MRTCTEYEALISAFIDGVLPEADRAALMEHMAVCTDCQAYFNDQIAIHDALSPMEETPAPAELAGRIMDQVRAEPRQKRKVGPFPHWQRFAALAACFAVAVVGIWALDGGHSVSTMSRTDRMAAPVSACADDSVPEPAPFALAPTQEEKMALPAEDSAPVPSESAKEESSTMVLTTGSPVAAAWVEDTLGLEWTAGSVYPLTEEQYNTLLELLLQQDAPYTSIPASGGASPFLLEAGLDAQ